MMTETQARKILQSPNRYTSAQVREAREFLRRNSQSSTSSKSSGYYSYEPEDFTSGIVQDLLTSPVYETPYEAPSYQDNNCSSQDYSTPVDNYCAPVDNYCAPDTSSNFDFGM